MKSIFSKIFAIALSMLSFTASAAGFDDMATIKTVTPLLDNIQHSCPVQQVQYDRNTSGSIVGGIAGALLGNQVGGGHGRTAATVAGAIVGTISGDRVDNRMQAQPACIQQAQRISGYLVTYEYQGRMFQSTMPYDPGQGGNTTLRVAINLQPR